MALSGTPASGGMDCGVQRVAQTGGEGMGPQQRVGLHLWGQLKLEPRPTLNSRGITDWPMAPETVGRRRKCGRVSGFRPRRGLGNPA